MSGPGRPKIPTALKILRGNPGHQKLNAKEPAPAVDLGKPPSELSLAAKRIWRDYGKQLLDLGMMTRIDEASFAAFCQTYARWLEVNTYLRDAPLLLESAKGGLEINPAVKLLDQLQTAMMKAATEFGLSPSSRSKVTTNTVREDELGDFLGTGTSR